MIFNILFKTYPGYNSKKALKAFPTKELLIKFTLTKLIQAIKNYDSKKINLNIVIDAPTPQYLNLVQNILNKGGLEYKIIFNEKPYGNEECFATCLDQAINFENSFIFFIEDDYLIHPRIFHELEKIFFDRVKPQYLLPYTHPDYKLLFVHKFYSFLKFKNISSSFTLRASGCLTFITTAEEFRKDIHIFRLFSKKILGDHNTWKVLTMPFISFHTIVRELIFSKKYKLQSIKVILKSMLKLRRPLLASTELPYGLHLSNEAIPPGYEYINLEADPRILFKEYIKKIN